MFTCRATHLRWKMRCFIATLTITKKCGKTQKLGVKKEILHSSDDHRLYSRF